MVEESNREVRKMDTLAVLADGGKRLEVEPIPTKGLCVLSIQLHTLMSRCTVDSTANGNMI
jgi:hypothetical protein